MVLSIGKSIYLKSNRIGRDIAARETAKEVGADAPSEELTSS
nr:hypothetical protein [Photobacterium damselae]